ncbi:MAG: hypothetical protein Q4Q06_00555, partial [Bacteroidota bacterium]|nr:hypothetical protein [Bacteroidota bacterium]
TQIDNSGQSCVNEMLAKIRDEEIRVLRNQYSIPEEEKIVVLKVTSTLRASLQYWDNNIQMAKGEKGTIVAIADAIGTLGGHTMSVLASKAAEKRLKKSINISIVGTANDGFVIRY